MRLNDNSGMSNHQNLGFDQAKIQNFTLLLNKETKIYREELGKCRAELGLAGGVTFLGGLLVSAGAALGVITKIATIVAGITNAGGVAVGGAALATVPAFLPISTAILGGTGLVILAVGGVALAIAFLKNLHLWQIEKKLNTLEKMQEIMNNSFDDKSFMQEVIEANQQTLQSNFYKEAVKFIDFYKCQQSAVAANKKVEQAAKNLASNQ